MEFKGIPLSTGFDLQAKHPLDKRAVVEHYSDLSLFTDTQKYIGMYVYVIEHNTQYKLSPDGTWETNSFGFIVQDREPLISDGVVGFMFLNKLTGDMFQKIINPVTNTQEWSFVFKIKGIKGDTGEQGIPGERGPIWNIGNNITGGNIVIDQIFSTSGVSRAIVNDLYLNSDTSDVYICTTPGGSGVAKWKYSCNIKGVQGLQGIQGSMWFSGDKLRNLSGNPFICITSEVDDARLNDLYLDPVQSRLFKCVVPGDPNTAMWKYIGNLQWNEVEINQNQPTDSNVKLWINPTNSQPMGTVPFIVDGTVEKDDTWSGWYLNGKFVAVNESLQEAINTLNNAITNITNNINNNLNNEIQNLKDSVSNGKRLIANAITDKGVNTPADATFAIMAGNIGNIRTTVSGATFDQSDLLAGKTAVDSSGRLITGTMPNRGLFQYGRFGIGDTFYAINYIPAGYYGTDGAPWFPQVRVQKQLLRDGLGITRNKFLSTETIAEIQGSIPVVKPFGRDVAAAVNNNGFRWTDDTGAGRGTGIIMQIQRNSYYDGVNWLFLPSPNFSPENIREGVNINGTIGTLKAFNSVTCTTGNVYTYSNEGGPWDDNFAGRGRGFVIRIPNSTAIINADYVYIQSPNLRAENIREGININGMWGTLKAFNSVTCTTGNVYTHNNEGMAWDDVYANRGRGIITRIPNSTAMVNAEWVFLPSPNLYPNNIRSGVNINGVWGTMVDITSGATVFNGATFDQSLVSGVATKGMLLVKLVHGMWDYIPTLVTYDSILAPGNIRRGNTYARYNGIHDGGIQFYSSINPIYHSSNRGDNHREDSRGSLNKSSGVVLDRSIMFNSVNKIRIIYTATTNFNELMSFEGESFKTNYVDLVLYLLNSDNRFSERIGRRSNYIEFDSGILSTTYQIESFSTERTNMSSSRYMIDSFDEYKGSLYGSNIYRDLSTGGYERQTIEWNGETCKYIDIDVSDKNDHYFIAIGIEPYKERSSSGFFEANVKIAGIQLFS